MGPPSCQIWSKSNVPILLQPSPKVVENDLFRWSTVTVDLTRWSPKKFLVGFGPDVTLSQNFSPIDTVGASKVKKSADCFYLSLSGGIFNSIFIVAIAPLSPFVTHASRAFPRESFYGVLLVVLLSYLWFCEVFRAFWWFLSVFIVFESLVLLPSTVAPGPSGRPARALIVLPRPRCAAALCGLIGAAQAENMDFGHISIVTLITRVLLTFCK